MGSSENQNQCTKINFLCLNEFKSDIRNLTVPTIEQTFYHYGITVARRPTRFILLCLFITAFASIGLINFTNDKQSVRLWISQDSAERNQSFPINLRTHTVIYEADNVLLKEVLLDMFNVHKYVSSLATNNTNWENICFRVPQTNTINNKNLDKKSTCGPELSVGPCLEKSILQIWGYNRSLIESLSQNKIMIDINNKITDAVSGYPVNALELFGDVKFDAMGDMISAKSSMHSWITVVDEDMISKGDYIIDVNTGFKIDYKTLAWEKKLMNLLKIYKSNTNVTISFQVASDVGLIINSIISLDLLYLVYGIILVSFYAIIKVGRMNLIHQKPWTSICGLACVVKAILFSYGLCSAIGIPYGTANHIIPILLLGLCVNNMFTFSQSWSNLSHQEMRLPLPQRVGCMMRDAWLSITITFIVTLTIFLIGSLSIVSTIRCFSLYAAIAVAALYFFQATAFIAWFTVDQKRLEDSRNGLLFCLKHRNWKPSPWSQKQFFQTLLYHLCSKFFRKQSFKIIVLVITSFMATGSSVGVYNLQKDIEINWLVPQNSHVQQFLNKVGYYYPFMGEDGHIVFSNDSLQDNLDKIESLINHLKKNQYVGEVQNMIENFEKYLTDKGMNIKEIQHSELFHYFISYYTQYNEYVQKSPHIKGWKRSKKDRKITLYSTDIQGLNSSGCVFSNTVPLSISFKYRFLNNNEERYAAMNEVSTIIEDLNSTDGVHIWSAAHHDMEMKHVIGRELYQILVLTVLVTFVATLLLASSKTSLLISLCVVFTLVDVGCFIALCGLTINVITSVSLLVGVGLCIDYCVHIARTFMVYRGTQDERAHRTITSIGPAVIKGGLGSIISIILLTFTESYFFSTFFKVLFATILLGLFHALVFLPVTLSLIGPEPYVKTDQGRPSNNISTFTMINPKYIKSDPDENDAVQPGNVSLENIPISCSSSPDVGSRDEQLYPTDTRSSRGFIRTISP